MRATTKSTFLAEAVAASVLGLLVTGCAPGSGDASAVSEARLTLAITDAASDDLASFVVDVTAVELGRIDGRRVGVLPEPVTVDLTSLAELSQVVNVLRIPSGRYVRAQVTLDFSSARARLVGRTVPATVLDGDGNPLDGALTVPVSIGDMFRAAGGQHHVLEVDFDLDQSVRADTGANTVYVEPALVLRVDRADPKRLFVGGLLRTADESASSFSIELQTRSLSRGAEIPLIVDDQTIYQIDGRPLQGAAGLAEIAARPAGTWVQCYGAIDPLVPQLVTAYVEAGTGTYRGGTDIVEGFVVGRLGGAGSDPTLVVWGQGEDAGHTRLEVATRFTVLASRADTKVVRRGELEAGSTDDLNVGQLVRLFGTLSGTTMDLRAPDAVARLIPTRLLGYAEADAVQGTLDLALERVGRRDPTRFAWDESGASPPDPRDLHVAVGNRTVGLGVTAGTPVEVVGFFAPVDDPGDDFHATAVVNRDRAASLLLLHDRAGGLSVTTSVGADELLLALSGTPGAGELAVVDRGFVGVLPLPSSPSPRVVPAASSGFYVIRDRRLGSSSSHLSFARFAEELGDLFARSAVLYNLSAVGRYDVGTNTLAAGVVFVTVD